MKKTLATVLIVLFACCSPVFAGQAVSASGGGFLLTLFIGFFSLILVFQVVPATLMLLGMAKGMVGQASRAQQ